MSSVWIFQNGLESTQNQATYLQKNEQFHMDTQTYHSKGELSALAHSKCVKSIIHVLLDLKPYRYQLLETAIQFY